MAPEHGRHRLFDAKRRPGLSFVMGPTGVWHSVWRGQLHIIPREAPGGPQTVFAGIDFGPRKV